MMSFHLSDMHVTFISHYNMIFGSDCGFNVA